MDELVEEAIIDDKRDVQVQFRAKIIDLAVRKRILDFPNDGEIVARLWRVTSKSRISFDKDNTLTIFQLGLDCQGNFSF